MDFLKKYKVLISVIALILLSIVYVFLNKMDSFRDGKEGFWSGRGGRGGHGGHGAHGRYRGIHGGRRNYIYREPIVYTSWWNSGWNNFWNSCKNGCVNIGQGNWGCQYPGNGPNDCIFANDCNRCNNNRRRFY